jgi:tetratricopeptide (TPR) repeat protein
MNSTEDQKTDQFKPYQPDEAQESQLSQWLEVGSQKLGTRDYKEAIKLFEKILRVDPENLAAFEKLSIARSAQADMNRIEDYLAMGRELMHQFDWNGAYDEFQAVLSIDAENEEAKSYLREVEKHLDRPQQGSDDDLITTGGEDVMAGGQNNYLSLDSFESDLDQETESFGISAKAAFTAKSSDPEFQRMLEEALMVYENNNLVRAKELLEKLQKRNPEHAQVQFYLTAINRRIETESVRKDQVNAEDMFKKGMDSLERQEFDEARNAFQKVLQIRPEFQQAQLMLDKIDALKGGTSREKPPLKTSGDHKRPVTDTLEKKRKQTVSRTPKPAGKAGRSSTFRVVLYIVLALLILGAAGATVYLLHVYPNSRFESFLAQARELNEKGKYEDAIPLIESALIVYPDSLNAMTMLGQTLLKAGEPDKAVKVFLSALELDPENKAIKNLLARAYFDNRDWEKAETYYRMLLEDPQFHDNALLSIALTMKNRNLTDRAIDLLQAFLEENDQHGEANFYLAGCYQEKGMHEETVESYLKAIEHKPDLIEAYEQLADYYKNRGQYNEGIDILKKLLAWFKPATVEASQRVAKIRFTLGEMQYENGDFKDAVENFTMVIQIEPSVEAYRNLGRSHYKMERLTEAILVWRRGLDLNPSDVDLLWQIGVAQFRQGDMTSAENSYKEALRIKPDHVRSLTNLGFIYYQQYKYDLARRYWRQSLDLDPDQPGLVKKLQEINR